METEPIDKGFANGDNFFVPEAKSITVAQALAGRALEDGIADTKLRTA
jgi:hypothetical protein